MLVDKTQLAIVGHTGRRLQAHVAVRERRRALVCAFCVVCPILSARLAQSHSSHPPRPSLGVAARNRLRVNSGGDDARIALMRSTSGSFVPSSDAESAGDVDDVDDASDGIGDDLDAGTADGGADSDGNDDDDDDDDDDELAMQIALLDACRVRVTHGALRQLLDLHADDRQMTRRRGVVCVVAHSAVCCACHSSDLHSHFQYILVNRTEATIYYNQTGTNDAAGSVQPGACVCACVRACVRVCVRVCVCACVGD